MCTSTQGSVSCTCAAGFMEDGTTCVSTCSGIDGGCASPCSVDNGGCGSNATCSSTAESLTCTCNAGYVVDGFGCAPACSVSDGGCSSSTALVFTTEPPASVTAGATFTVAVSVEDSQGDVATGSSASVTLSLGTNAAGATLQGTLAQASVNGVATFPGLTIDQAGTGYTLMATSASLSSATSIPFDVIADAHGQLQLVFAVQPSNTAAGVAIGPAVAVAVEDEFGNIVTSAAADVTVSLISNPTDSVLLGALTVPAVGGVATFTDLTIQTAGAGYTLGATSGVLSTGPSTSFSIISGPVNKLAFAVQPSNTVAGVPVGPAHRRLGGCFRQPHSLRVSERHDESRAGSDQHDTSGNAHTTRYRRHRDLP